MLTLQISASATLPLKLNSLISLIFCCFVCLFWKRWRETKIKIQGHHGGFCEVEGMYQPEES